MFVVIDDLRTFDTEEDVTYLRTSNDALACLAKWWTNCLLAPNGADLTCIEQLWLDHDLGPNDDIMIVVNFLVCLCEYGGVDLPIMKIYAHTQNPVGVGNIIGKLNKYFNVDRSPLPSLLS